MPKISACLIVRDEEKHINHCLESIKLLTDKIIVVDTGSIDNTKQICLNFGAVIYDYEWCNNFSAARNFAASKADGDWILWIDADEEFVILNKENLLSELDNEMSDFLTINMTHYYGTYPVSENKFHNSLGYRFYRNFTKIKFVGTIHEHLDLTSYASIEVQKTATSNAIIKHYGYMDETVNEKNKANRNLKMLLEERLINNDPWIPYHIGSEYYRLGKYSDAYSKVNLSILEFLNKGILPPSMLYKLKYQILMVTGSTENVLQGLDNAIKLYNDYVDLYFYKGIYLLEQNQFENAINTFYECLKLDEKNNKYLILFGAGSYLAWYYIGVCYQKQNKFEEAKKAYKKSLVIFPDFKYAVAQLAVFDKSYHKSIF